MAAILEPNEFKRVFEKSERYALAFVEVKKLDDTKNLIKRAKDAKGILEVEKKIAQQLVKTRAALQTWEKGLSQQWKQMAGSRRVMKSMDDEKRINDRNLAESTQRVGEEATTQKKAGNAQGQLKQYNALLDKTAKDVKGFEEFRKVYEKLAPKVQDRSLPAGEMVSLEAKVKPLVPKVDQAIKILKKLEKDYGAIAEAEFAESMDKFAQAKLKDSQQLVDKLLEKIQKLEIPRIAEELKGGRKELYGDKVGWMELVKKSKEQAAAIARQFPEATRLIDHEIAKLSKVKEQYPETKAMPNAKPPEFAKRIQLANDFRKAQFAADEAMMKKFTEVSARSDAIKKQAGKQLRLDFHLEQRATDKEVADAGKELEKLTLNLDQLREAANKRLQYYVKMRMPALNFLQDRILDYKNAIAATQIAK